MTEPPATIATITIAAIAALATAFLILSSAKKHLFLLLYFHPELSGLRTGLSCLSLEARGITL